MAIQVGEAIAWGMSRVGVVLFRPFAWRKWAALAAVVWLGEIHEMNAISGGPWLLFDQYILPGLTFSEVTDFVNGHLWEIFAWMTVAVIFLFGVYLLFRWVNCRGRFMMLEAVVKQEFRLKESWREQRMLGNSLLWFRIKWDLAIFNVYLAVIVVAGALVWPDFKVIFSGGEYRATGWTWSAVAVGAAGLVLATVGMVMAQLFLNHLMLPAMYVRKWRAGEAFRRTLRELVWPHKKACVVYLLSMLLAEFVQGAAAQVALMVMAVGTCLIGVALLYVPVLALAPLYLAMGLALPVEVFLRAYSLRFVEQFGVEYQVGWEGAAPRGGFEVILDERSGRDSGAVQG